MHRLITFSFLAIQLSITAADYFPYSETWPEPRQAGWDRNCLQWYKAETGDTCWQLVTRLNMGLQDFLDINPQLENDCVHNLWAGYWYCTAITMPPGMGPTVTTIPPQNTESDFTTNAAATTPLATGQANPCSFSPVPFLSAGWDSDFTTKSTDAASFSPITEIDTGACEPDTSTTRFVKGTRPPVLL
jgi:hypothetical protein